MSSLELKFDRGFRLTLGAIVALLGVIALGLWGSQSSMLPAAYGQIPDSGRQRLMLLEETKRTNQLLAEILDQLRNQPIKVEMKSTDSHSDDARAGGSSMK